jgi:hypothetical protein
MRSSHLSMGRARLGLELNDLPEGAPSSRLKTTCVTCSVAALFSCVTTNKRLRNYLCNVFSGDFVQLRNH